MKKEFNQASRSLFSAQCPVTECKEGKPSNKYLELKIYDSYFNLLDNFAEFKTQFDAISKQGHRVWHSEFEINDVKYTIKALDNQILHTFSDENGDFSTVFLPEGYVKIETADNVEWKSFAELHKELRQDEKLLNKFDEAFVKAEKTEITDEYFSDLRIIFANSLSPMHALAKDEVSFNKMLGLIGTYRPEIIDFVFETYNSPKGLSQILEHQADISLKELRATRPAALEDVLEAGMLQKFALAVKRGMTTLPGMLVATAGVAVAADHNAGHDADSKDNNIESNKDISQKPNPFSIDNGWEKINTSNDIIKSLWGHHYGLAHISKHDEILLLQYHHATNGFFQTWVYHLNNDTWENKTSSIQPPEPKEPIIAPANIMLAYDSKNDKVVYAEYPSAWVNQGKFETWVYDVKTNIWTNKTTGDEPSAAFEGTRISYDEESGKIVAFPCPSNKPPSTCDYTYTYDAASNKWESKDTSLKPASYYADFELFYVAKEGKVSCISDKGRWSYDAANGNWENKSGEPQYVPESFIFPSSVSPPEFAYDAQSNKLIMLAHGFETWLYDLDKNNWSDAKPLANIPYGELGHYKLIYDAKSDRVISTLIFDEYTNPSNFCPFEVWQYYFSTPAQSQTYPTFIIPDKEILMQGTPQQTNYPAAGDDNNVANNHANGLLDQQQFTAGGKPIVLYNEITGSDGYLYKQYILYETDNPVYVLMPGFKDHHAQDIEAVIDKCTLEGKVLERATSYHIKYGGGQFERGWKFTNDATKPVYIELAGHAMSANNKDFSNPFDIVVKDPANNEDLHPAFYHKNGRTLTPENYVLMQLSKVVDNSQIDAYDRYKTEGYPEAAPIKFGDASKVPWKSTAFVSPWIIFNEKDKSEAKSWQNLIEGNNIEVRLVAEGSRLVLGEENGEKKADLPGTYVAEGNKTFLAADFSSYDNVQLEICAKGDTHYKDTMYLTKNVNGQSVVEEKIIEKDIKKGETQIVKLNPDTLQPTITPGNGNNTNNPQGSNNSITWTYIAAGTAGIAAAIGIGYVIYRKRNPPKRPQPAEFYMQQQQSQA